MLEASNASLYFEDITTFKGWHQTTRLSGKFGSWIKSIKSPATSMKAINEAQNPQVKHFGILNKIFFLDLIEVEN